MTPTIHDVLRDWFGPLFAGATWQPWRACLTGLFGLKPTGDEADQIRQCTGRAQPPTQPAREGWLVVGRRGGKSRIAALVALYLALFRRYELAPGERGVVMVIARDRRQARIVRRYVVGLLESVPALAVKTVRRTAEAIDFNNGISIEIHTASFRAVRGYTVVGAVLDEIAFWPTDDAANPDAEIVAALRPAMATIAGALLLAISSPYARRGELWRAYHDHHAKDGDVFVWQADTRTMNPSVPQDVINQAYAEDEAAASAEYGAQFRRDLEAFVSREVLDAVIVPDRRELPRMTGVRYVGFVDPSGGSSDSMTLAIAHRAPSGVSVLDLVREVTAPFDPNVVTADFARVLREYHCSEVRADHYAGEWPIERFRAHGIHYRPAGRVKSEYYAMLLPRLNAGEVELLDVPRLRAQLERLERRKGRSGRDTIDHPPRQHDDVANAAAGALVEASGAYQRETIAVIKSTRGPHVSDAMQQLRSQRTAQLRRELEAAGIAY